MTNPDDDNAIQETAYLLRSPANAERLRASVAKARAGEVESHGLLVEPGELPENE